MFRYIQLHRRWLPGGWYAHDNLRCSVYAAHLDGTLDLFLADCQQFAHHLAGCNPCQLVVDNIRNTIE